MSKISILRINNKFLSMLVNLRFRTCEHFIQNTWAKFEVPDRILQYSFTANANDGKIHAKASKTGLKFMHHGIVKRADTADKGRIGFLQEPFVFV
jgi:hypothetical protein